MYICICKNVTALLCAYLFESIYIYVYMKLKKFCVSEVQNEVLNWGVGLFLAFSVVNLIDHWTGMPNEGQNVLTQAFSTVQSTTGIQIAESILLMLTKLTLWEVFRRCLNKSKHFILQLAVVVMMVLTGLSVLAGAYSSAFSEPLQNTLFQVSQTDVLIHRFCTYSNLFVFLAEIFLGIGLIRKFSGSIRNYGLALLGAPVLSQVSDLIFYYIYNNVGGVSMNTIQTLGVMTTIFGFVLSVIPFIMLRLSMSTDIPEEDGDGSDLNQYK